MEPEKSLPGPTNAEQKGHESPESAAQNHSFFYRFEALQPTSVLWSAFVFLNRLSVSVTILGSLAQFPVMKHKNLEVLVNIFWTTISAYNKVTAKIFSDDPKPMELFNILS